MIEQTIYWYSMAEYGLPTGTIVEKYGWYSKMFHLINLKYAKLNAIILATIGISLTVMNGRIYFRLFHSYYVDRLI